MTPVPETNCQHTDCVAELLLGSYFVKCSVCNATLITIPWFSAESLLKGNLVVSRIESPSREKVVEGSAEAIAPYIRQILMFGERLALSGPHAVIDATELGDIKNNPLTIQRDYFSQIVSRHPHDESAPFALAQVLRELGEKQEADACYDAGLATANSNWLRKFPLFALPSILLAAIMWWLSIFPWLCVIVALIGPAAWLFIFRNRRRWLPMIGFTQRSDIAAKIDMTAALSSKTQA